MAEIVVEYVKSKPHGCTIDEIAAGTKDNAGSPRRKVGSLRPQLPLLVRSGQIKQKPNPQNLRQNLYFVE
jgi:hypothetical protein